MSPELHAVAIVGMACRFPGASDLEEYWRNLCSGVESILSLTDRDLEEAGVAPDLRGNPRFVPVGTEVEGYDRFEASFFGLSSDEAATLDPQVRIFLECAWQALEDSAHPPGSFSGVAGVYAAAAANGYSARSRRKPAGRWQGDPADLAGFVSSCLGLRGPSHTLASACSSSLVAVHLASEGLLRHRCDLAVAGGVSIRLPQKSGYLFEEGGIVSPDGRCRAFDAAAAGTVFGSGAGAVVLKRLDDALADRDPIAAILLGSAVNNDGSARVGFTAPGVAGQAEVVRLAQAVAAVRPDEVSYVEAHGTGTPIGDALELEALGEVFGPRAEERCFLGSVKPNLGHLETASGIAGLIKTALALENRVLPPSLHFDRANPAFESVGSGFQVVTEARPWEAGAGPRRAGVSSFGIGGTNAHLILQEAEAARASGPARPAQLLVLSAAGEADFSPLCAGLARRLKRQPGLDLADVAYTLQTGRASLPSRLAFACSDRDEAISALEKRSWEGAVRWAAGEEREVAFLFPGQGTQYVGVASELYRVEPSFRRRLDRCADLLLDRFGFDLRADLFPAGDPAEAATRLASTAFAQPALFALEHCLASLWIEWGVRPAVLLGDSLGEYVAACVAGVFTVEEGLELLAERGRLLEAQVRGAMLAVALSWDEAERWCAEGLEIAAVHGSRRCVVAGSVAAVEGLGMRLAAAGIAGRRIPVTRAFHSSRMAAAAAPLRALVSMLEVRPPRIPILSNVTGTWLTELEATDPGYWARHLLSPVRLDLAIEELLRLPGRLLLEVGPGRTLAAAVGQGRVISSLPAGEGRDCRAMLAALGKLWVRGVAVDWSAIHAGEVRSRVRLPAYPFAGSRCRIDPPGEISTSCWVPSMPPATMSALSAPLCRRWLLLLDGSVEAEGLAGLLRRLGCEALSVRPGDRFEKQGRFDVSFNPRSSDDFVALRAHLREMAWYPERIVDFLTVGLASELGLSQLEATATALSQLRDEGDEAAVVWVVISSELRALGGNPPRDPQGAMALGALGAVAARFAKLRWRSLDLGAGDAAWDSSLVAELSGPGDDPIVAYRRGVRWIERRVSLPDLPVYDEGAEDGCTILVLEATSEETLSAACRSAREVAAGGRFALVTLRRGSSEVLGAALLAFAAAVVDAELARGGRAVSIDCQSAPDLGEGAFARWAFTAGLAHVAFAGRPAWVPEAAPASAAPAPAPLEGDSLEAALCAIWQEVLGVAHVGVDDHFLELGGDSILSTLIAHRARAHGLRISPEQIFLHPTVARLVPEVERVDAEAHRKASEPSSPPAFALDPSAVARLIQKRSAAQ